MSRAIWRAALALLLLATAPPAARAQPASERAGQARAGDERPEDAARALRWALEQVAPAVVEVEALGGIPPRVELPGSPEEAQAQGVLAAPGFKQAYGPTTGLIVRADGLIVTSTHALAREPRHLIVTLADGRAFTARLLGRDETRALALLRIEADDLPAARPAPPAALRVGRAAVSVGLGLGTARPVVAEGLISAVGRLQGRALQTSALASPVNYGGPLLALDGAVLGVIVPLDLTGGIASVDLYDSGIGFAVPLHDVLAVLPRLERGELLEPGFLGVVPDPAHHGGGVRVAEVAEGSPAAAAALEPGHVVLAVDGERTDAPWRLARALARKFAGEEVELEVRWQTETRVVRLTLAPRPQPEAP